MKFRDHPLLLHRWPPTWLWGGGDRYIHAIGEVGGAERCYVQQYRTLRKVFFNYGT